MAKNYFVIDETGEIVKEIKKGDYLYTQDKTSYFVDKRVIEYKFTKMNIKAILNMTELERNCVFILLDHIRYETNEIYLKRGTPVKNIKEFAEIFEKSEGYTYNLTKKLISSGIIGELKFPRKKRNGYMGYTKSYIFNPYIAMKGRFMSNITINYFEKSNWRGMTRVENEEDNNVEYVECV